MRELVVKMFGLVLFLNETTETVIKRFMLTGAYTLYMKFMIH